MKDEQQSISALSFYKTHAKALPLSNTNFIPLSSILVTKPTLQSFPPNQRPETKYIKNNRYSTLKSRKKPSVPRKGSREESNDLSFFELGEMNLKVLQTISSRQLKCTLPSNDDAYSVDLHFLSKHKEFVESKKQELTHTLERAKRRHQFFFSSSTTMSLESIGLRDTKNDFTKLELSTDSPKTLEPIQEQASLFLPNLTNVGVTSPNPSLIVSSLPLIHENPKEEVPDLNTSFKQLEQEHSMNSPSSFSSPSLIRCIFLSLSALTDAFKVIHAKSPSKIKTSSAMFCQNKFRSVWDPKLGLEINHLNELDLN